MSAGQCDLCICVLAAPDTMVSFAKVNLKRKLARLLPAYLATDTMVSFAKVNLKRKLVRLLPP